MKEYIIKRVSVSDKKADGGELITKNGKPFLKVGIQVAEYGERWANGLYFAPTCPWQEGSKETLKIFEEDYQGKMQLKWEMPKQDDKLEEVKNAITKLNIRVSALEAKLEPKKEVDYPEGEPDEVKF